MDCLDMVINITTDDNGDINYESNIPDSICYITKRYTKKNGEVVIKKYNQSQYKTFYYMNNKKKLTELTICECGGQYNNLNKYNHKKGKIHKQYEEISLNNNNVL